MSYNSIKQNAIDLLVNIPTKIERYILSNNNVTGTLPHSLENLRNLRQFSIDSNGLSGELPDFSTSFPNLRELSLSKQEQGTGFTGRIPESLSNLPFLSTLNLAGNHLTNTIPSVLGNLALLKTLDLSYNELGHSIPTELGKLGGKCFSCHWSIHAFELVEGA